MIKWQTLLIQLTADVKNFSSNEPDRDIQNHITPIGKPFTRFYNEKFLRVRLLAFIFGFV